MSKLEELIKEFCPNGVDYKKLNEVCTFNRGTSITSKDANEGNIPVISGGQKPAFYHNVSNRPANTITVAGSGAYAGYVAIWDKPIFCADSFSVDIINEEQLNKRYLYHYLLSKQSEIFAKKQGAGIPHVHGKDIASLKIPLPALPVQREIVRILDSFTLYSAELTAELTARRKQYEFYRDKLLTFDTSKISVKKYALSEIAEISTGTMNTEDAEDEGAYPFFVRSQEPLKSNRYQFNEEAIITAGDGVGVGKVFHYIDGKYALHQRAYRIHPNQSILKGKFLFHYFTARFPNYICKKMFEGSVPSIRRPMLNDFSVTIPSIEVQERIVKVLDNFDAICSDLGIGLPAEIEKRQKQYEYYREKLLTFDGKSETIFRQTDRQTDRQTGLIRLLQYVYGFVNIRLGDISQIVRGASPRPICNYITDAKDGVNWVKIGDVLPNSKYITGTNQKITKDGAKHSRFVKVGDFILSNSMSFGRPYIMKIEGCIHDGWLAISDFEDYIISDYLYYLLTSTSIQRAMEQKASFGGAVSNLNAEIVRDIEITIPSLEKQKEIVDILDRFDNLCNDISKGLPAEIEARQKQYEFYRNKLLNFKDIEEDGEKETKAKGTGEN